MPYPSNKDLPKGLKEYLPSDAQTLFREVFNDVWESAKGSTQEEREEKSFRIAWSVVKKHYHRGPAGWVKSS